MIIFNQQFQCSPVWLVELNHKSNSSTHGFIFTKQCFVYNLLNNIGRDDDIDNRS